jgi:ABC-type ATPase involved in cell division
MELFKAINQRGTTIVIASHNMVLARQYATRHINIEQGRITGQD